MRYPEVPEPIRTNSPHRAVAEDFGPPVGVHVVCAYDGQDWPCDYELDLRREEP